MYRNNKKYDALTAKFKAQQIAFGPIVFQAAKALLDLGVLKALSQKKENGATVLELSKETKVSEYGLTVLLESGLSADILYLNSDNKYCLSNVGLFLLKDELTQVNMNFVHDVCYKGMFHLKESILENRPAGLDEFGQWRTIYDALSSLPEPVKKSWFAFDHFYSDIAFNQLLPIVFEKKPLILMDIGANTGKWALKCFEFTEEVQMILVDLPGQIEVAKANINNATFSNRASYISTNILDNIPLKQTADIIWMSQFLDCFSKDEIIHILKKAKAALNKDGKIFVLETFWDTQRFEASAFSLHNTSLYFTCMANGNSKMYHSEVLKQCAADAGLKCVYHNNEIGLAHTLLQFAPIDR